MVGEVARNVGAYHRESGDPDLCRTGVARIDHVAAVRCFVIAERFSIDAVVRMSPRVPAFPTPVTAGHDFVRDKLTAGRSYGGRCDRPCRAEVRVAQDSSKVVEADRSQTPISPEGQQVAGGQGV